MTTFKIVACKTSPSSHHLTAEIEVANVEEARELRSQFPKGLRLIATSLMHYEVDGWGATTGLLVLDVDLRSNGVTGEVNETGIRRYRSFRKHAARLGFDTEWVMRYVNSITEDQLEELIAA